MTHPVTHILTLALAATLSTATDGAHARPRAPASGVDSVRSGSGLAFGREKPLPVACSGIWRDSESLQLPPDASRCAAFRVRNGCSCQ
jgi:hypothetical protein